MMNESTQFWVMKLGIQKVWTWRKGKWMDTVFKIPMLRAFNKHQENHGHIG